MGEGGHACDVPELEGQLHSDKRVATERVRHERKVMEWTDLDDQDKFEVEEAEKQGLSSVPLLV